MWHTCVSVSGIWGWNEMNLWNSDMQSICGLQRHTMPKVYSGDWVGLFATHYRLWISRKPWNQQQYFKLHHLCTKQTDQEPTHKNIPRCHRGSWNQPQTDSQCCISPWFKNLKRMLPQGSVKGRLLFCIYEWSAESVCLQMIQFSTIQLKQQKNVSRP